MTDKPNIPNLSIGTVSPQTLSKLVKDAYAKDKFASLEYITDTTWYYSTQTPTPATPDELQMLVDAGLDLLMFDV